MWTNAHCGETTEEKYTNQAFNNVAFLCWYEYRRRDAADGWYFVLMLSVLEFDHFHTKVPIKWQVVFMTNDNT